MNILLRYDFFLDTIIFANFEKKHDFILNAIAFCTKEIYEFHMKNTSIV